MSQVLYFSVLASAILLAVGGAQAQTDDMAKSRNDVMTIYATGNERDSFEAPMMVTVIKSDAPEAETAGTVNAILRRVAGISVTGTGRTNGQDVTLRGFDRRGILTLVDGVRQGTDTGHVNGTFIDPALIRQVEVIRGPSALLYGSGAMGGVIAWETVDAKDLLGEGQSHGFRVFSQAGTGDRSFGLGGTAFGRSDSLDGLFSFVTKDVGNIRLSDGDNMDNKEAIANLLAKGTWYVDDAQRISGQLRYYHNNAYEPKNPQQITSSTSNVAVNRTTRQRDAQAAYRLKPAEQDWLDLNVMPYYTDVNITAKGKSTPYEERTQKTYGVKADNRSNFYSAPLASHSLTYGSEAYRQNQTPRAATTQFPDAEIAFTSGFLQDEITLKELPVSFIVGTRYDRYRATSDGNQDVKKGKWSSKGAVSITPTQWSMLFASYSEAFRAPSMMEMYNDEAHFQIGPIVNRWRPNPNLQPESTRTAEYGFGLRFDDLAVRRDSLRFKASYFDTKAKDYINTFVNFDFTSIANNYTTSINTKRAKIWGWDASMEYQTDDFSWSLGYNHTQGLDESNGKSLTSIKPDSITSNLTLPIGESGFSVGWIGEFTHHTDFNQASQAIRQAGYAVNDVYISYKGKGQLKGLGAGMVLGNAFDKSYYSAQGIPQDGRNAKVFVSYQW